MVLGTILLWGNGTWYYAVMGQWYMVLSHCIQEWSDSTYTMPLWSDSAGAIPLQSICLYMVEYICLYMVLCHYAQHRVMVLYHCISL